MCDSVEAGYKEVTIDGMVEGVLLSPSTSMLSGRGQPSVLRLGLLKLLRLHSLLASDSIQGY